jgi:hypothetical protein
MPLAMSRFYAAGILLEGTHFYPPKVAAHKGSKSFWDMLAAVGGTKDPQPDLLSFFG